MRKPLRFSIILLLLLSVGVSAISFIPPAQVVLAQTQPEHIITPVISNVTFIEAGSTNQFGLRIQNTGIASTAPVTVTANLPVGITYRGFAAGTSGFDCSGTALGASTVTCTSPALPAGYDNNTLVIQVDVDEQALLTGSFEVTISINPSPPGEPNTFNNTAQQGYTVNPRPNLVLSRVIHIGDPAPGSNTQGSNFLVGRAGLIIATIQNPGNGSTTGTTTLTFTLPTQSPPDPNWTFNGVTASGGVTFTCDPINNPIIVCNTTSTIAPGNVIDVQISVTPTQPSTGAETVTVVISGGGEPPNYASDRNTNQDTNVIINGSPALTLTKTHVDPFIAGAQQDYVFTVTNAGTGPTTGPITLTDALPAGMTYVSFTSDGGRFNCSGSSGSSISCVSNVSMPTSSGGDNTEVITVTVQVPASATGSVTNFATVTTNGSPASSQNTNVPDPTSFQTINLQLSKTDNDLAFAVGGTGTYDLTIANIGSASTGTNTITLTDTLPTGLTYPTTAQTVGNFSCIGNTATPQVVTCTSTTAIAAGGNTTLSLVVNVGPTAAPGPVTNTATVAVLGDPATNTNNQASDTTVIQSPDLAIDKTPNTATFTVGASTNNYTITVTNAGTGPLPAGTNVQVVDTLPAGGELGPATVTAPGWSCLVAPVPPAAAATVTCDIVVGGGGLAAAAPLPTITINVAPPSAASGLTNNVTVTEDSGFDQNTANDSDSVPTSVNAAPVPTLEIVKSAAPTSFTSPSVLAEYILRVRNVNASVPAPAGTVTLTDQLPTGLTFIGEIDTDNVWAPCTPAGQTITCVNDATIPAGATYAELRLQFSVASGLSGSVSNTASVQHQSGPQVNSNTLITPIVAAAADLTINKSHATNFQAGTSTNSYTIVVNNIGNADAVPPTITVTDNLPTGFTEAALGTGTGWTCTGALDSVASCTYGLTITAGGSSNPLTLTVAVQASPPGPAVPYTVDNNVDVTFSGTESDVSNNNDVDPTVVSAANTPDLTVSKTHTDPFTVNGNNTYTITVTNIGTGTGSVSGPFQIVDTLPTGFTFVSNSTTGGWQTCSVSGQTVTCNNTTVTLAPGASLGNLTLTVMPTATTTTAVNNVSVTAKPGEASTTNNSDTDPTTVVGAGDLAITKTAASNFQFGQPGSYTISVDNIGTADVTGTITVTDTLPAGLTYVNTSGGGGFGCSAVGQNVTCTRTTPITPAEPAANITINVNVGTSPTVSNPVNNTATVSVNPAIGDPYGGPNSDTESTPVTTGAAFDIQLTKSHIGNFTIGQQGTYTIAVRNTGGIATTGTITITDVLNSNLTYASSSSSPLSLFTCSPSGQTVTCTNTGGNIPANGTENISLVVNVSATATAGTTFTNTATAAPVPGEASTTNNQSNADSTTLSTAPSINPAASNICATPSTGLTTGASTTVIVRVVDTAGNGMTGQTVVLNASTNPASMSSSLTTTGPTTTTTPGEYRFTVSSSVAGTATFSATVNGTTTISTACAGGSRSATWTAPPNPNNIASGTITATPTTVALNGTSTVVVNVRQGDGDPAVGASVTLNYTTNTGSNTGISPQPGAQTFFTDTNGNATFTLTSSQNVIVTLSATATQNGTTINISGPSVTFGSGGTTGGGTGTGTGTPGTVMAIDCIQIPADNIRAATITITMKNASLQPVAGKTFTVAGTPPLTGMTIQPASAVTDALGVAKFTVRSTAVGGPITFTATNQTDAQTVGNTVQLTFAAVGSNPCVPAPTTPGTLPGVTGGSPADGTVIIYALCIRTGPGFAFSRYAKALPFRTAVTVLGRTTRIPGLGPRDNCIKKGGPTWYFVRLQNGATVWANASYIRLNDRNAFRTLPVLPQPPAPGTAGAAPSGAPIGEPVPSSGTATPTPRP